MRYVLLVVSTIAFAVLAFQLQFEEDITKLLPSTGDSQEQMAFDQLRVKDKIFVLMTSRDTERPMDPDELVEVSDDFVASLGECDTAGTMIEDILYEIDSETMIDLVSYLSDNFP